VTTAPTTGWQPGTTFSSLTAVTGYYVWARSVANANYITGTAVRSEEIGTQGYFESNPFLVNNEDDLRRVGTFTNGWLLSAHYRQTANIILKEGNWKSIGPSIFYGSYDGGGFYIADLKMLDSNTDFQALIAINAGNVRNVALTNVNITCNKEYVGGIAGTNRGTIENCYVAGSIEGRFEVGGIAGSNEGGTIMNCYSTSTITGLNYVGGITGEIRNGGRVEFCYATKNVLLNNAPAGGGGIAGNVFAGSTVQRCVALNSQIKDSSGGNIGRVAGVIATGTLTSNYANNSMSLISGTTTLSASAGPNTKDGESITSTQYNSATWWQFTALFPPENWSFVANQLPRLKTTTGVIFPGQTPAM